MRILIADDDQSLSRVLQIQLESNDHQVTVVFDGKACLDEISNDFDVCVLDLNMPKLNGLQVLESLDGNMPCPIVVLTAYDDVKSIVKATKLSAFDYLTKPFEAAKLLRTIDLAKSDWDLRSENKKLRQLLLQKTNVLEASIKNSDFTEQSFVLPKNGLNVEELLNDLLAQALERCNNNQTKAGKLLGLSRQQVIHRMRKWKQ
ncbi:MAG: response regulator [Candidatus Cloacimonetes bacterium]|nr:response regulator [Candidatus Cloacimonadota bacterium]